MRALINRIISGCLVIFSCAAYGAERVTYFVPDAQGSPAAAMDEQGNVIWRESYKPYGERRTKAPANGAKPAYAGKPEDPESGFVYMGARSYDPEVARFTGIDPKGFDEKNEQSFGRYTYVNNSPYVYVDPDGRELKEVNLNGIGKTYLDDAFSPKVDKFVEGASGGGVKIKFNSAYRAPEKQSALKDDKAAITPADKSLHSAGFAVDVNYSSLKDIKGGLTGDKQREVIRDAAEKAGLSWGGSFATPDPPHFYVDPGNRDSLIEAATKKYQELTK